MSRDVWVRVPPCAPYLLKEKVMKLNRYFGDDDVKFAKIMAATIIISVAAVAIFL